MTIYTSKVQDFFNENPSSFEVFRGILADDKKFKDFNGSVLVYEHMNPMIDWSFNKIRYEVDASSLTKDEALFYIKELSVFARYNAQFLKCAADKTRDYVVELAHEFERNFLEEGGERGHIPSHFVLYSSALLKDLDILVNGHLPCSSTQTLVNLFHVLVNSHCPSTICGAYYSTEGVAIDETEILRDITNQYGNIHKGKTGKELVNLDYYYCLHLDEEHEAARGINSVEKDHMEGIAKFICEYKTYNLELPRICDGFLQMMEGMTMWWTMLSSDKKKRL